MKAKKLLRAAALLLCTVMFSCVLFSCARAGSGKSVSWLLSTAPRNLDPQTASSDSELLIIKNCFRGLFEKNADGEIFSSIVRHYGVSEDGLQYSFYLYDDIYWSIYEKREARRYGDITAQDFAFAIKRLFTDNPNADVMRTLKSIKNADKVLAGEDTSKLGIYCKDEKTLIITLSSKNDALIEAFCSPALFPCNEQFFSSTSGRYGLSADTLIFNGSFLLGAWGESSVKLVRNNKLENPANLSSVTLYLPKSTREHVALLKEGDIDAALLSSEQYDKLSQKQSFYAQKNTSTAWALVFNEQHELWKNKNLRNAVILCTDRGILNPDSSSHFSLTDRIISDTAVCFSENYRKLTSGISAPSYDSAQAKVLYMQALSELSLSEIYNAEILIPDKELCKKTFSALNQVYQRELSLYFSQSYLSEQAVLSRVKSGDFAAALIPLEISTDAPSTSLEYFVESSPACILPVTNGDFSTLFTAAQNLSDAASAAKYYGQAESALYSSALVAPLYFENSYFVTSLSASGFVRDKQGAVLFHSVDVK
ncbi:MAG: ABC transporter substrate-binding protein [Oscillospiraceae bacterium]|nr:ABC transporter substrate-binding protein [Oscillospiraceae bacterium]